MKLLSCYIAGFGKFVNRAFDLSGQIVVFQEENGWGKTTLADFIKCMLYGMDAGRGKAVAVNDRLRYEPWQGGTYGGTLVFTLRGKTYRVERTFGRTPAQDIGRVFDSNNLLSYEFGERAEFLGERIFGVNAESFQRTVYVPQGDLPSNGLPEDLKGRLLALLSADTNAENGGGAIARLEDAERKLRAKRKPAKGKLDEIDERIELINRQEQSFENNRARASAIRASVADLDKTIDALTEKLRAIRSAMEEKSRQNEREAQRETTRELELGVENARRELQTLREFFGQVDVKTLNVVGLENAVAEYYALKERVEGLERRCLDERFSVKDTTALETQAETCRQRVAELETLMQEEKTVKIMKPKMKTVIPPKRKSNFWILLLAIFTLAFGAVYCGSKPVVGLLLLGFGGVGALFVFFRTLPKKVIKKEGETQEIDSDDVDFRLAIEYETAKSEWNAVLQKLQTLRADENRSKEELASERESLRNKLSEMEVGIKNFLNHFRFGELYDYRSAVASLKENMLAFEKAEEKIAHYETRLQEYTAKTPSEQPLSTVQSEYFHADMQTLKLDVVACERELSALKEQRVLSLREAETYETTIDYKQLVAERAFLQEEKARLERRYSAVCSAKELLLRAKENMASRYLEPVAKGARTYLSMLQTDGQKTLRFTGEGIPVYEDNGGLRELAYYSKGGKELTGLCVRLALADAVFAKEPPPLVLDDPFVNFDDEKTEKAKSLIRALSQKYQILYFTCKGTLKL